MFKYQLYNLTIFAQEKIENCDADTETGRTDCVTRFPQITAGSGQITTALTVVFGVIGAMAVLYMVLAGLKFVNSQGDPQATSQARQSIIYGAVGLAVAVSAEVLVNLVLKKL
jgi:hypothetical protein